MGNSLSNENIISINDKSLYTNKGENIKINDTNINTENTQIQPKKKWYQITLTDDDAVLWM